MRQAQQASVSRLFCLLAGGTMLLAGIAGFLYEHGFGTGSDLVADEMPFGLPTNGIDNTLHIALGLAGLAFATRAPRAFAIGGGALLIVLALIGMSQTEAGFGVIFDAIPVSGRDNLIHLLAGLAGLAAAGLDRVEEKSPGRPGKREPASRPAAS